MKKPTNAYPLRIDWLEFKAELKPIKDVRISLFQHYLKVILNTLKIPDIDTTTTKETPRELIVVDDISKVVFKFEYNEKTHVPEFTIEFQGFYFIHPSEGYAKAQAITKLLNKKLNIELVLKRFDIAQDIEGKPTDYLKDISEIFFNFKCKIYDGYKDGNTGEWETLYITNKGKNQLFVIIIYFKSEEVKNKSGDKNEHYQGIFEGKDFIRIEIRLKSYWATKFTGKFYTMKDPIKLCRLALSKFSNKKRAYIASTLTENEIENGNANRGEIWPLWEYFFQPTSEPMDLKQDFFISSGGPKLESQIKKLARFFVMAKNDGDFDKLIKEVEEQREELTKKRESRKKKIAEQAEFFGSLLGRNE